MAGGKKIFLIRHGQTDYNLNGIVQGSGVNSSLNPTGRLQAGAFYDHYSGSGVGKIFVSALVRTHESVEGFIRDGIPWEIVPELNEISWGKHEGKTVRPEDDSYYQWLLQQWRDGNTAVGIEGGESPDEVAVRLRSGLDRVLADDTDHILICMHGRAMRIMLCVMMGYPLSRMDEFEHQNLCLYELDYTADAGFRVVAANSVVHLERISVVNS